MAPLKPNMYAQNVPKGEMGTIPDRMWLAFIQSRSRGALSASKSSDLLFKEDKAPSHPDDAGDDKRVFDPYADFLPFYAEKRQEIADRAVLRVGK